jgi:hypothetical protein
VPVSVVIKAMRKTAFAEIFVFASFGNRRFSKIRTGASYSSFFRTRPDSRKSVPTRSDPNFREKSCFFVKKRVFSRFSFSQASVIAVLRKLGLERVIRAFSELVSTRENSFRLETRLESSEKSSECRALVVIIDKPGANPT